MCKFYSAFRSDYYVLFRYFFLGLNFVSLLNIIEIGLNMSYFYCTKSICGLAHVQKNI